jgi:hypothetical protein
VWFSTENSESDKAEEEGSYSSLSSSPFSPCKKTALALHDSKSEESTSEHEAEERSLMTSIGLQMKQLLKWQKRVCLTPKLEDQRSCGVLW